MKLPLRTKFRGWDAASGYVLIDADGKLVTDADYPEIAELVNHAAGQKVRRDKKEK